MKNGAAVIHFWQSRTEAVKRQKARRITDQGKRSDVTSGKHLDGFIKLAKQIIIDNGIEEIEVYTKGKISLTIPGFFRPTKTWDLLVVSQNRLLAAIELKSQVGPSFGNNFNNRVEEALGNATDLNTAYREGVFGESSKPFVGYVFVLEECEKSLTPVKFSSPHFRTLKEFEKTSYAQRYEGGSDKSCH
ncbi:MAG TPA: restriction endonuclease, partial [Thiotrichaceae bacterium]|nr:restriction endonuclease [Thiotrichaceae bacterium]